MSARGASHANTSTSARRTHVLPARRAGRRAGRGVRRAREEASREDEHEPRAPPPPWVLPGVPTGAPLPPPSLGKPPLHDEKTAPPSPEHQRSLQKKKPVSDDFYANVGLAIRTLREELPTVFQEDISYDIYTDDVGLVDEFTGAHNHLYGKRSYQTLFKNIRIVAHVLFAGARLEILRIWQPDERRISMRWTVRATPRLFGGWASPDISLDGISEYHLDSEGKIYQHVVERRDWDISRLISERAAQLWPTLAVNQGNNQGVPSFYAPTASYDEEA